MNHQEYAAIAFNNWERCINPSYASSVVLDAGCRDDVFKKFFVDKGFSWIGLDPYPQTEGILKGRMESMYDICSETHGLVFACHSFEHCERPVDALREFLRVLKTGGWLFIAGPPPTTHHVLCADADHIFCLHPEQLSRLLTYAGFVDVGIGILKGDRVDNDTVCAWGRKS